VAVVDVVITAGQSQMSGVGDSTQAPTTDPTKALEWMNGPGFIEVKDNVSSTGDYKAQTGSPIPAFCNTFTAATGRPLAVVRAAVGGTSLLASNSQTNGNWDTSGARFGASVTRAQAAISALTGLGHTIGNVFVIWSQGYADAKVGNDLELYEAANAALVSRWRTALTRPALRVYQELMYAPAAAPADVKPRCLELRDAQLAGASYTDGLKIAFTEGEHYAEWKWLRWDNLHYNQTGLNYMGRRFAEYVADDLGFVVAPPETPPASRSSIPGRHLTFAKPLPPLPRDFGLGTTRWAVPLGQTALSIAGEGAGGKGGNGSATLKGGAGGGGAYCKLNTLAVTPGEEFDVFVAAGGSEQASTVTRVSDGVIVFKVAAGKNGVNGNPAVDGAGGLASDCIGDVKTSGQNGGVTGIDTGGNGAAPLGGAGGVGPGAVAGQFPGGGGAGALQGAAQVGGAGASSLIRISAA
jgi:hypothetical protein